MSTRVLRGFCRAVILSSSLLLLATSTVEIAYAADQLPPVKSGNSYDLQIPVALKSGVNWPFSFRLKDNKGPDGFTLDPNKAVLSSPKAGKAGNYSFTVEAVQGTSVVGSSDYTLDITTDTPVFSSAALSPTAGVVKPKIVSQPIEGAKTISVDATPTKDGVTTSLDLQVNGQSAILADSKLVKTDADGHAVLTLAAPLEGGETLTVSQTLNGKAPKENGSSEPVPAVEIGNTGRARYYFTLGLLSSADDSNFSKQNIFASFLLDKMFRPSFKDKCCGVHTFFDARLTAVPVAAQTSGSGSTPSQPSFSTLLASQKAAVLTGGMYFPFITSQWSYHGSENAFYIAPLFKVGVENPIGSLDPTTNSSTTNSNGTSTTTTSAIQPVAINGGRLYNFFGAGVRLGHVSHYKDANLNPNMVSHLDLTWGKYSNLEAFRGLDLTNPAAPLPTGRTRMQRLAAEGLLKVPNTPLFIGFSANVGVLKPRPTAPGGQVLVPRDDLRFLFGTKFDLAKLWGKLPQ